MSNSELDSVTAAEVAAGSHPVNWPALVGWAIFVGTWWWIIWGPLGMDPGWVIGIVLIISPVLLAGFGVRSRYTGWSRLAAGLLGALGTLTCLLVAGMAMMFGQME